MKFFLEDTTPNHLLKSGYRKWQTAANSWKDLCQLVIKWKRISLSVPCYRKRPTNAVLGQDFLFTNDAIINFSDGTYTLLALDNSHTVELSLKAINSQPMPPMASLLQVHLEDNHPAIQP